MYHNNLLLLIVRHFNFHCATIFYLLGGGGSNEAFFLLFGGRTGYLAVAAGGLADGRGRESEDGLDHDDGCVMRPM